MAQRRRERRASFCSARRSARRCACAGSAPTRGLSDSSVHPAGMALIQGTAYRARRRMQRMTASGTMPSTGRPAASRSRTSELETGTCGPSTHSTLQPGATAGAAAGRAGHDGQGDQALEVLVAVPGAQLGDQVGAHDQEELDRAGRRPGPGPPPPCPPSSSGRPGRSRAGSPRRPGSPRPGPRSARSGPRRARSARCPDFCHGSLATTSRRRSSPSRSMTARAAATWPACGGSKVPPKIPIRAGASGAGKFGDHRAPARPSPPRARRCS